MKRSGWHRCSWRSHSLVTIKSRVLSLPANTRTKYYEMRSAMLKRHSINLIRNWWSYASCARRMMRLLVSTMTCCRTTTCNNYRTRRTKQSTLKSWMTSVSTCRSARRSCGGLNTRRSRSKAIRVQWSLACKRLRQPALSKANSYRWRCSWSASDT